MRSIQTRKTTRVLAENQDEYDEYDALSIEDIEYDDGQVAMKSTWVPTFDELNLLREGGAGITVTILGSAHPPIAIGVEVNDETKLENCI